jgi:hypothetical protein
MANSTEAPGSCSEAVKRQICDPRDSGKILIEGEHGRAMLHSNGRDQSIDRGQGNSFSPG